MGETDQHRKEMIREMEILERHFAGQRVYVSGDLLVYYVQGDPKKFVVPDVFVVKDLEPRDRRIYRLWVERKPPDVVIEVTSKKTKKKDTISKPELYATLGIHEFFLFDPTHDYLDPPLQGHRLAGDDYERILPDEQGALLSAELGLRLQDHGGQLMFYRSDTGERLLSAEEARRAEAEARRAEAEGRRAEAEARRAEAEARRAAEAEVARLREELRRLRGS
jgi:Uma2 family endonuclease